MSSITDRMPLDPSPEARARRGVKFDGTINLGHISSALAVLITGVMAWNGMDKRVLVLEEARLVNRDRAAEITAHLEKIDSKLERISDQITSQTAVANATARGSK